MMALLTGTLYDSGCLVAWKQWALPAGRDEIWTPQAGESGCVAIAGKSRQVGF